MKKNIGGTGLKITTAVLGAVLVVLIVLIVMVFISSGVPRLSPSGDVSSADAGTQESTSEDTEYIDNTYDGFEIKNTLSDLEKENVNSADEAEAADESDYLWYTADTAVITENDKEDLLENTADIPAESNIFQMVINEMYARHGYKFKDDDIQDYFNSKEWYQAIEKKTKNMDKIYKNMNDIEKENLTILQGYMAELSEEEGL